MIGVLRSRLCSRIGRQNQFLISPRLTANSKAGLSRQLQRGVVHADQKNGVGEIDIPAFGLGPPPQ